MERNAVFFNRITLPPSESFLGYLENEKFLSHVAKRLQSNIEQSIQCNIWSPLRNTVSHDSSDKFDLMNNQSKDDIFEHIIATID